MCIEHCAVNRDCSGFEPKPNLKLIDLPRFPETKDMTREEKFTSVTIYLSKVVDYVQRKDDEYTYPIFRPNLYRARSSSLPQNIKIEDLLPDIQKENSSSEVGEERSDSGVRPSELASNSD